MDRHLHAETPAAEIAYFYGGEGARLHAGAPLLELRIGDSPLQTVLYGGMRSVVVRRVLPEACAPIDALPSSIQLALVEGDPVEVADATEAVLSVSIFRQGYYQALLSLASRREAERTLVLEVLPARIVPSRLSPRYRTSFSRAHLAPVLGRRMETRT